MKKYYDIAQLRSTAFYQVDKNLIAALDDFLLAGILSMLINTATSPAVVKYRKENDDYFFVTVDKMQEELRILDRKQRSCLKKLESLSLIKVKNFGVPCRRHIKVLNENVCLFLNDYLRSQEVNTPVAVETKDEYYENLNEAIFAGSDEFTESIHSMNAKTAAPLYVFTRALYAIHGTKIKWSPTTYGKFKNIIGFKDTDLQRMINILQDESFKTTDNPIWNYRNLSRKTGELSPSERVYKASDLEMWDQLSGEAEK